jgi:hypothetical protein
MIALISKGALAECETFLPHLVEQGDQNMVCHSTEITGNLLRFLFRISGNVKSQLVKRAVA